MFPAAKYLYAVKVADVDPPSIMVLADICRTRSREDWTVFTAGRVWIATEYDTPDALGSRGIYRILCCRSIQEHLQCCLPEVLGIPVYSEYRLPEILGIPEHAQYRLLKMLSIPEAIERRKC